MEAAVDRVQSELAGRSVFRFGKWHQSQIMALDELDLFHKLTRARLDRLYRLAYEEDADEGIREFFPAAPILYEKYITELSEGNTRDNRKLWSPTFEERIHACASVAGRLEELCLLGSARV